MLVSVNAEGLDLGDYSDMITITSNDPENSSVEVPVTMSVIAPPQITADFTADTTNGETPLTVSFTDLSAAENTTITGWLWDFGDDSTSTEQNPTHVYETAGVYTVSLTVFDG